MTHTKFDVNTLKRYGDIASRPFWHAHHHICCPVIREQFDNDLIKKKKIGGNQTDALEEFKRLGFQTFQNGG